MLWALKRKGCGGKQGEMVMGMEPWSYSSMMEPLGQIKRGRPRRRYMDVVREDIEDFGVTGEECGRHGEVARYDAFWRSHTGIIYE